MIFQFLEFLFDGKCLTRGSIIIILLDEDIFDKNFAPIVNTSIIEKFLKLKTNMYIDVSFHEPILPILRNYD